MMKRLTSHTCALLATLVFFAVAGLQDGSSSGDRDEQGQSDRASHQQRDQSDRDRGGRHGYGGRGFDRPWHWSRNEHSDRGDWGRSRDSRGGEFSDEFRDRIIVVLHDLRPSLSEEEVQKLRDLPDERFRDLFEKSAGHVLYLARLRDVNQPLYQLKLEELKVDQEVSRLARGYREAVQAGESSDADLPAMRGELAALVTRQWNLRLDARELEIEALQRRVNEMRESLARERTEQDERVQRWLDDLAAETSGRPDQR